MAVSPRTGAAAQSASGLAAHTVNPAGELLAGAAPGSLLDSAAVQHWHETIAAANEHRFHTYQLPLDRRASASSSIHGEAVTLFSSYSYLGLNGHPRIDAAAKAAIDLYGTTTGGARLLTGTLALHLRAEAALAEFLGVPAAGIYQSGYDANLAAVAALFHAGDTLLLDEYVHRSLHDGARLSGARVRRWRHNRLDVLERHLRSLHDAPGRRVIVVDGVYSMEGDLAPLAALVELKQRYGALLVMDESHAIGALGARGRGTCEATGVDPHDVDVITGSLGKAIPSTGGFVAGSQALITYLQYGSTAAVFSGAASAATVAAVEEALLIIDEEPQHLRRLHENTRILIDLLRRLGLPHGSGRSAVVPLELGDDLRTWRWARTLLDSGVAVSAVLFPAVPPGRGRLRLCATGAHRPEHFEQLEAGLRRCTAEE